MEKTSAKKQRDFWPFQIVLRDSALKLQSHNTIVGASCAPFPVLSPLFLKATGKNSDSFDCLRGERSPRVESTLFAIHIVWIAQKRFGEGRCYKFRDGSF